MLTEKAAMYSTLGISKEVFAFGTKIEEELKERFAKIDEIAEYNQLKVIHAMQARTMLMHTMKPKYMSPPRQPLRYSWLWRTGR